MASPRPPVSAPVSMSERISSELVVKSCLPIRGERTGPGRMLPRPDLTLVARPSQRGRGLSTGHLRIAGVVTKLETPDQTPRAGAAPNASGSGGRRPRLLLLDGHSMAF